MGNADQAGAIRSGEEIDSARVESFLKDSIPGLQGQMTIQQFPNGHSNLTYLITCGDREMVLRRPPFGTKAKTAHDMGREYRILSALNEAYPYCPRTMAYWIEKNDPPDMQAICFMPTNAEGALTRDELVRYYVELSGMSIDNYDFYYCFGLFRLAVIAQQIYYRFFHGQTRDKRFEAFIWGVHALDKTVRQSIDKSSL